MSFSILDAAIHAGSLIAPQTWQRDAGSAPCADVVYSPSLSVGGRSG